MTLADASTVFRALQRIERGLGRPLFERTRSGYLATELATQLAGHAEQLEAALEAARLCVESAARAGLRQRAHHDSVANQRSTWFPQEAEVGVK